jgi:hypothetical protein
VISVVRLFGPLVLWLGLFSAVYGVQGIACAQGWQGWIVQIAWAAAIILQAALLVILMRADVRPGAGPERFASIGLGVVGLVAVIWTMFPTVILTGCS